MAGIVLVVSVLLGATLVTGLGEQLTIRERLQGDASTDMGSLSGIAPAYDSKPLDPNEHERLVKIMEACWRALDRAARASASASLEPGSTRKVWCSRSRGPSGACPSRCWMSEPPRATLMTC
jgi:hypothetical protein